MGRAYNLEGRFDDARESGRRGAEVNRYDPWGERCPEAAERIDGGMPVLVGGELGRGGGSRAGWWDSWRSPEPSPAS